MPSYAIYDVATGRIRQVTTCDAEFLDIQPIGPGQSAREVSEDVNNADDYMEGGFPVPRPTLAFDKTTIVANGVDEAVLANLPNPTTVLVDGAEHVVTDGTFELSAIMPATYVVEVPDPFPYLSYRAEVVAT